MDLGKARVNTADLHVGKGYSVVQAGKGQGAVRAARGAQVSLRSPPCDQAMVGHLAASQVRKIILVQFEAPE